MPKQFHMRQSVRGAIRNRAFEHFQHDDGRPMKADEAFDALCDCLKKDVEYIKVGECIVAEKWHTPAHNCTRAPVKDGYCMLHLDFPSKLRVDLDRLRLREKQLVAMTEVKLAEVRGRIAAIEKQLPEIVPTGTPDFSGIESNERTHATHGPRAANGTY